jgi:hypothetical protein
VSTDVVVVAAPFATPGVEGAEALARRYALLVTGVPQDQLEEHAANGLPQLSDTVDQLRSAGLDVAIEGNGNLHDWLLMMMLKHQLIARPALLPLDDAYDMAYNLALSARNHVAPYYRHLVCGRRGGSPSFAPQSSVTYDGSDESLALIGSWLTATAAELGRQDVATEVGVLHNRSEHIEERLARLEAAVLGLVPRLDALSEGLAENRVAISDVRTVVGDVQAVVAHTHELIRHPVRSMVGKAQKRNE